jgi:DNA-binding transcriptional MerR regulator
VNRLSENDKRLIRQLKRQGIGFRTIAKILDNKVSFQAIHSYWKNREETMIEELLGRVEKLEKAVEKLIYQPTINRYE